MSRTVGALVALALCAAGCAGSAGSLRSRSGAVQVVAVENTWGDIVRQIGGSHVSVTSILKDPSADPHTFETDPSTAAALSGARFVVQNGLGYDEFASKLLRASSSKGRRVLTVSDLAGVSGDQANPHLWYSSRVVTRAATAFAAELSAADPSHAGDYRSGLDGFLRSYAAYAQVLAQIKREYARTKVAYTERVPGYLVEDAGLALGIPSSFPQAIEDGNDPSLSDVAAVRTTLRDKTVKVLLYNGQVASPVTDQVRQLAKDDGVPVVAVTETLPSGQRDFQSWQVAQATAVLAALSS